MDSLVQLEQAVRTIWQETLQPLAQRLALDLPDAGDSAPRLPSVLFLGNHSSGKSSFINYLIGSERQKTGLAPTDDGFTVLTYGDKEDEFDGHTVVTHPDLAFRRLQVYGPTFLSKLRLKTHPAELLQSITLIDSPGMIDAAGTARSRGYDFAGAVRCFAEMSDLVLFFFDPDKPGTTGETVSVFTETLVGLEHKLLIVMNKVDLFANIRDFARTYGTLCWNLSKTMPTKDVPHIFNTCLPGRMRSSGPEPETLPTKDFEASREEVVAEIRRAPTRRADNLVSDLLAQSQAVSMQGWVVEAVARRLQAVRLKTWVAVIAVLAVSAVAVALAWDAERWTTPLGIGLGGGLLAVGAYLAGHLLRRREQDLARTAGGLDPYFEAVYRRELLWHDRADLRAHWEQVRPRTLKTLELLGRGALPGGFGLRRQLRRLDEAIATGIPKLRREVGPQHRKRESAASIPGGA